MKKIITLVIVLHVLLSPALFCTQDKDNADLRSLPEYTGSLNNPDLLVVEEGEGYQIVLYEGKYYVVYDK